jgi:ATP-binding cassette, subfamily B, bacterial
MSADANINFLKLTAWAWRYARRFPLPLATVLGCMAANVALSVLKPWPMVFIVDYVLRGQAMPGWLAQAVHVLPGSDRPLALATWAVAATILIFLLDWLCGIAAKYANVSLGQRITYAVAADSLRRLQQLSLLFHSRRSTGDSVRRVTSDSGSIAGILRDALLPVVSSIATLATMLVIMWRLDPSLTLVALLVAPCMAGVFRLYAGQMLERSYREYEGEARIYEVVEQTFSALPAVKAFAREAHNTNAFRQAMDRTLQAALGTLSSQLQFKVLMNLATALGTAAILWIGTHAVLRGEMTVGTILLFVSYLAALYTPLEAIMYTGSMIQTAGGSARRVLEVLHTEPEVIDRPGAPPLLAAKGRVGFADVGFAYEDGRPILRGISLEVAAGETIALVGPTGAGKSTLVSLIPRFFDPTAGRVLIDGRDIRDVQVASLRDHVALVLQEPFLFPLTIAENIAYGRLGASRAEVETAARAANAHEFIKRLPEGYDTAIGERGATLSGGERQRIAIARALLKDAPILILDEPTSAVDAESEALIMAALQNLSRGRTTFIIAHRLTTVRNADRIVLLHDGVVAEMGTHEDLIQQGGVYSRYARLQGDPESSRTVAAG